MKTKTITLTILAIIALGFLVAGCQQQEDGTSESEDDTIKIGAMFPLTGKMSVAGTPNLNFAKMAVEEINSKGGVNGKNLELVVEDDKCSGNDAVSAANRLIKQEDIDVLIGPGCTPASAPVAPVAEKNEVFMLAATTTTKNIFNNYSYAFRVSPDSTKPGTLLGKTAYRNHNISKAAVITEQGAFPESWANDFASAFKNEGGEVVSYKKFLPKTDDFRTILSEIKTKVEEGEVDSLYLSTQAPGNGAQIFKALTELGIKDKVQIMTTGGTISPSAYESSGGNIPESTYMIAASGMNKTLMDRYVNKYGKEPTYFFFYTAGMYDGVYMIKQALKECGEDSTCIRDYFKEDLKYSGSVTTWEFDENGDPIIPTETYVKIRIVDGEKVVEKVNI